MDQLIGIQCRLRHFPPKAVLGPPFMAGCRIENISSDQPCSQGFSLYGFSHPDQWLKPHSKKSHKWDCGGILSSHETRHKWRAYYRYAERAVNHPE